MRRFAGMPTGCRVASMKQKDFREWLLKRDIKMNLIKQIKDRAGFSLMEVNMAVFVLSIGILSMIVLYPLGLRESMQGQADIKQSMFADYMLNMAVGIASQTNITWKTWYDDIEKIKGLVDQKRKDTEGYWPGFIADNSDFDENPDFGSSGSYDRGERYEVRCALVPGMSDRLMGIMIQSTDLTKNYDNYTNNPIFYAEVMFQGDPFN